MILLSIIFELDRENKFTFMFIHIYSILYTDWFIRMLSFFISMEKMQQ